MGKYMLIYIDDFLPYSKNIIEDLSGLKLEDPCTQKKIVISYLG